MRRFMCILLTAAMLLGCISINFVSAASNMTTKDGFLDVEAENLTYDTKMLNKVKDKMFSGSAGLGINDEDKTQPSSDAPAHLDLSFTADKAGTYNIWLRHTAEIANMSGQNVFMAVNGGEYQIVKLAASPEVPGWVKLGTATADSAKAKVSVKIRRRQKNSIVLDRVIITSDALYTPDDAALGIAGATPKPSVTPKPVGEIATFAIKDGVAKIEAEDTTIISDFTAITGADLSGGKGLNIAGENDTKPGADVPGQLEFNIKADKTGKYVLWMYANPTTVNKSVVVSINGGDYKTTQLGAPASEYEWRKIMSIPVTNASESVNVRVRASVPYYNIDQFYVVDSQEKKPVGIKPTLEVFDATKLDESLYPKPEFTPPEQHPRLYFTKADIPQILENAKKPQNQTAWMKYQDMLTKDIANGVLPAPAKEGTANVSNAILGTIEALAFNYVTEGNEENGKKAIEAIQNYMETLVLIDPNNDNYTRNGGHAIFTLAEVYDWCYPLLSQDDMKHMVNLVVENIQGGMEVGWPPVRQSSVVTHGSEAQIIRDLNSFAIAVYDERPDIYNVVVGRFMADYVPARKFHYTSNMFHQGSGYGSYRGQWDFNATWIFDRMGQPKIFGDDQQATAYWFLYMRRPDGQLFRDGDASTNGSEIGAYAGLSRLMMLAGNYYQDPYLKQEAMRSNTNLSNFAYGHGNMSPVEFLCFNDPELGGAPLTDLPLTKYFGSPQGAMIARTGWNDGMDSPDAIAYMKINELWFANHHHLDAGSFQLYYKGILANDSGRYQGYGTEHDYGYNKRSIAHNTISVYDPNETSTGYLNINDGGQEVKSGSTQFNTLAELLKDDHNKTGEVKGHEFGPDTQNPEYTYLKGDITKAYNASKMEDYERSFMFLNLESNENPAALVVFDRVRSSNASFKKAWLLHGPTEPEINGNRTVFRNNENGYNGKMTVDTLLPKADNTEITSIGGAGKEAWVQGTNYSAGTELDMTKAHESDGYRIEVSPKQSAKQDYFLNVLQVGDCEPDAPALESTLIETDKRVGAKIADRVVMFALDKGRTKSDVEFSFEGDGTYKIMVADMEAGTYKIYLDGNEVSTAVASEEGGLLNFEGEAGAYKIVYADASKDKAMVKSEPTYNEGITIRVANKYIYTDVAPTIIDDRTLVPMRVIFEKLGADIAWDDNTQTVTGTRGARTVKLSIDDKNAYIDGKAIELDVPAMLINDRTMVPIRFVAESLNCKVDWDDFAKTVFVSNPMAIVGAVDENGNIYYPPTHDIANALPVYGLYQNDSDDNRIENSVDGDLSTRWAVEGTESWAWGTYDLGSVKNLDKAYLSFHNGHQRVYTFSIAVSEDGQNYTTIIDKQLTSGKTLELEAYDMKGAKGRYIKFLGGGNTVNMWNSLTEIVFTEKK